MWQLRKLNGDNVVYLISERSSYAVGRKNCNVILENDTSISRRHCTIYIARKRDCKFTVHTSTGIWVVDENSKYGTFLNNSQKHWEKLNALEEIPLESGSIIRFGLVENIWSLKYVPVIACTSGIRNEGKKIISNLLMSIDGELRYTWSTDCNLVIVNEITLTVKVVLAMINGVPMVKLDYLNDFINAVRNQQPLPDHRNYRPNICETHLDTSKVSLDPTVTRKTLFSGKTFVFPTSKQLETLREVIISAGGKTTLLDSSKPGWRKLGEENMIIIQLPSNKAELTNDFIRQFDTLTKYLQENCGRRVVAESEIAQAIAYSTTQKYCNPVDETFEKKTTVEETQDLGIILVEETPEMVDPVILDPCVIPCTSTGDSQEDSVFDRLESQMKQKRRLSPHPREPKSKISRSDYPIVEVINESDEELAMASGPAVTNLAEPAGKEPKTNLKNADITRYFRKQTDPEKERSRSSAPRSGVAKSTPQKEGTLCDVQRNLESAEGMNTSRRKSKETRKQSELVSSDECWRTVQTTATPNKRKILEDDAVNKDLRGSSAKRMKLPTDMKDSNSDVQDSTTKGQRNDTISETRETDSIEDFLEVDKTNCQSTSGLSQFDNSMYSITLISALYLKDDGTLKDPPAEPVNVKKFKKKNRRKEISPTWHDEEELSGDGWLEVHPLNASTGSLDGKYAW